MYVVINIFGDEEEKEESSASKEEKKEEKQNLHQNVLQKQVININGEIVVI